MSETFDLIAFHKADPEEYNFEGCYTVMNPDRGYDDIDVAMAIVKEYGVYSRIATLLGRSRASVQNFIEKNDFLRALREDVRQARIDEIEEGAFIAALSGDGSMQRFFLTTLGKDRGFVPRQETTGKDGAEQRVKMDFTGVPNEVMQRILNEMDKANKP